MMAAVAVLKDKQGCLSPQSSQSFSWVDQAPGHGSHLVEGTEGGPGAGGAVDAPGPDQQAKVRVVDGGTSDADADADAGC